MIFRYGDPEASLALVQMVDDHDLKGLEAEVAEIRQLTDTPFCLLAFQVERWNYDLSPWKAPAVFGKEDFGDGAEQTLAEVLNYCQDPGRTYLIGGYSLAGLFALWAACRTDAVAAVAAASPSVWFPGFLDYMKMHKPQVEAAYLSLGDKEEKTRNPVMATVGTRIREAYDLLKKMEIHTVLEWNPGNHFRDADKRTAKAFAWAMQMLAEHPGQML